MTKIKKIHNKNRVYFVLFSACTIFDSEIKDLCAMNKRNLFLTVLLFSILFSGCNNEKELLREDDFIISSDKARQIAEKIAEIFSDDVSESDGGHIMDFKDTSNQTESSKVETIFTVNDKENKPAFYIMNYKSGGYVILSADIRMGPILSISGIGVFEIKDDYPKGLNIWMANIKESIEIIRGGHFEVDDEQRQAWEVLLNAERHEIRTRNGGNSPLERLEILERKQIMNLHWNHHAEGYNDSVPHDCTNIPGGKAYVGCVPVTVGQLLRHWQYPKSYDWDNMPTTHATPTTASFLVNIGKDLDVYYTCNNGSGSYMDIGEALRIKYGYNAINDFSYTYDELKIEIDNKRPLVLIGSATLHDGKRINHAWICEGYMEYKIYINPRFSTDDESELKIANTRKLLFMNWGWNEFNGWYSNDKLINGAGRFYIEEMIKNIYPKELGLK